MSQTAEATACGCPLSFACVESTQLGAAAPNRKTHSELIWQGVRSGRQEPFEQASRWLEWVDRDRPQGVTARALLP